MKPYRKSIRFLLPSRVRFTTKINHRKFFNLFGFELPTAIILSGYIIYQFLETGLEPMLLYPLLLSFLRLHNKIISKSLIVCSGFIIVTVFPTIVTGEFLFGAKLIFFMVVSNFVVRSGIFNPTLFLFSLIIHIPAYMVFFAERFNKFDNLPFFIYAPNFFVFLFVFPLLAIRVPPFVVAVLSFASLSRWNFVSVLSSYSRLWAVLILFGAFFNLTQSAFDTTLGLKQSSDNDRLELLNFQISTLDEYIIGKPLDQIRDDIRTRVNFTTDTFEGIVFDAYSLFGIFGISIIIYHFRLIFRKNGYRLSPASIYLFLFAFFNPVIFSFSYFLFAEFIFEERRNRRYFKGTSSP